MSKSVRKSRQINSTIKRKGTEKKLTETRLKNAEKGKDYAGRGGLKKGIKMGRKFERGGGRERETEKFLLPRTTFSHLQTGHSARLLC